MSLTLTLILKILIFLSKQRGIKINGKLNIYLFNKILYSFKISVLVSKKSSYKISALSTQLLYILENINFNIKKILPSSGKLPNN